MAGCMDVCVACGSVCVVCALVAVCLGEWVCVMCGWGCVCVASGCRCGVWLGVCVRCLAGGVWHVAGCVVGCVCGWVCGCVSGMCVRHTGLDTEYGVGKLCAAGCRAAAAQGSGCCLSVPTACPSFLMGSMLVYICLILNIGYLETHVPRTETSLGLTGVDS